MVCRPHSSIGGQLLQLWLGISSFFFKSPSWIYPTSDHMQWWSYHWGQLFSKQNQRRPSTLDSSIILGAHQKPVSIKWHYLHERQLPNNLSPTLPFNLQSRACKKGGRKKRHKKKKKERHLWKACWSQYLSCFHPSLFLYLKSNFSFFFSSSSVIFLGAFQKLYVEVSF